MRPNHLFTGNAAENIANLSGRHFIHAGQVPNRQKLIELYYGEAIEAANLFIGFDKFNPANYLLLEFAEEKLYFTAAPSFYLDKKPTAAHPAQSPAPAQEPDYTQLSEGELAALKDFYRAQRNMTLGLGSLRPGAWVSPH